MPTIADPGAKPVNAPVKRALGLLFCLLAARGRLSFLVRQQRGVAAGSRGVHRDHLFQRKSDQIVRSACLRPGPRKATATERLAADDRAAHVAINADVAVREAGGEAGGGGN